SPYMASCQVFPSFYILSSGEEGWNIYPTTQVNPFTELFTQEIIITDQFDLPVYQYGWTSLDWFAPLNIPALGPGDYTITMNASGFLGAPGCYATYSLPYTVETMCPGDLDGNLTVNTADLLLLMSTFGDVCGQ
ncbi:MAG: hypothetical protein JNM00_11445, partial [Flavobacteriales bacterium]|nr:hypothetical protein [Flavobacteriales bacterium]